MTIIETPRLYLDEGCSAHATFIFELLNNPTFIEHIGNRNILSLKDAEAYIQKTLINSYKENNFGMYIMIQKSTMEAMGICGLLKRPDLEHPDIGFAILPRFTRNGYTFEAADAVLKYSKINLNISTVYGITSEANINSQNLLEKLGLSLKDKIQFGKFPEKSLLYSN